jgi:hypothetical protein
MTTRFDVDTSTRFAFGADISNGFDFAREQVHGIVRSNSRTSVVWSASVWQIVNLCRKSTGPSIPMRLCVWRWRLRSRSPSGAWGSAVCAVRSSAAGWCPKRSRASSSSHSTTLNG